MVGSRGGLADHSPSPEGEWSAVRMRGGVVGSKGGLEDGEGEWSAVRTSGPPRQ